MVEANKAMGIETFFWGARYDARTPLAGNERRCRSLRKPASSRWYLIRSCVRNAAHADSFAARFVDLHESIALHASKRMIDVLLLNKYKLVVRIFWI